MRNAGAHHAENESLQADVMRFMAIIAFCLVAILALVRGTEPVEPAPPVAAEPEKVDEAVVAKAMQEPAETPPLAPVTLPPAGAGTGCRAGSRDRGTAAGGKARRTGACRNGVATAGAPTRSGGTDRCGRTDGASDHRRAGTCGAPGADCSGTAGAGDAAGGRGSGADAAFCIRPGFPAAHCPG